MNEQLMNLCDLFIANRDVLKENFRWEGPTMHCEGAMLFTSACREASDSMLRYCDGIIKNRFSLFSRFRSMKIPLICKMSMTPNPMQYLDNVVRAADELERNIMFKTEYAVVSGMIICDNAEQNFVTDYVYRARMIFEEMKKDHSFLTSSRDIILASLLAVTDIDVDNLLLEMDECYRLLKESFHSSENQELSHILSLDLGAPGLKVSKFIELYELLKSQGLRFSRSSEITTLATASFSDLSIYDIAEQIAEVNEYLQAAGGFSGLSMFQSERLIYATMLVYMANSGENKLTDDVIMFVALDIIVRRRAAAAAAAA